MHKNSVYTIEFSADDMSLSPSRWTLRGIKATQQVFFWWGYMWLPDRNPILVLRSFDASTTKGGMDVLSHSECAKKMFTPTKTLDNNQILESDQIEPWHLYKIDDEKYGSADDEVYEISAKEPDGHIKALYRAGTRRSYIQEGDFLEITGENTQFSLCIDPPGVFGPYFTWSTLFKGKYYGQEVTFLGGADRFYSKKEMENLDDKNAFYWANIVSGVDKNGRKEYGCFYMYNGKTFAYYVKDGKEPKYSENVKYKAEWAADPANPNCVAPSKMLWGFDDIEIHWLAEYTASYGPDVALNHFGPWYEKNGSRDFQYYLGAMESNVSAGQIK